jgi:hypothetical protein
MTSAGQMNIEQKSHRSVSLISWGLNEEELLVDFLDRSIALLSECVEDFEIVFVDASRG